MQGRAVPWNPGHLASRCSPGTRALWALSTPHIRSSSNVLLVGKTLGHCSGCSSAHWLLICLPVPPKCPLFSLELPLAAPQAESMLPSVFFLLKCYFVHSLHVSPWHHFDSSSRPFWPRASLSTFCRFSGAFKAIRIYLLISVSCSSALLSEKQTKSQCCAQHLTFACYMMPCFLPLTHQMFQLEMWKKKVDRDHGPYTK